MRLLELNYLENRETKVSELKALELLREKCRNAHHTAKQVPIFRRLELDGSYYVINPEVETRKSKFLLENLITELPSWHRFPNRLQCVRGFTSHERADKRDAGEMFLLLPFDGARLGVTGGPSFIRSFEPAAKRLHFPKLDNAYIHEWLKGMLAVTTALKEHVGKRSFSAEPTTVKQLMQSLEKLEFMQGRQVKKWLTELDTSSKDLGVEVSDDDIHRALDFVDRRSTPLSYWDELLEPGPNNFALLTTSSVFPQEREIWTSNRVLAIRADKYDELHKRGDVK